MLLSTNLNKNKIKQTLGKTRNNRRVTFIIIHIIIVINSNDAWIIHNERHQFYFDYVLQNNVQFFVENFSVNSGKEFLILKTLNIERINN